MIFSIIYSVFGLAVTIRTIFFLISIQIIKNLRTEFICLISLGVTILAYLIFSSQPVGLLLFYLGIFCSQYTFLLLQVHFRSYDLRKNIITFLDNILIQMRSGRSLRESLKELGVMHSGPAKYYLNEILSVLYYNIEKDQKIKDKLFFQLLNELVEVNHTSHKAIDKLKAFRRKIKIESEFRQKSGQVTAQIKMQGIVLGVLYVALWIYSVVNYGFYSHLKIYTISAFLYLFGLTLMFQIGRNYKWKV